MKQKKNVNGDIFKIFLENKLLTKLKQSLKPIGGLINKRLQSKGRNNYALHIT